MMWSKLKRFEIALFERLQRPQLVGVVERGSFWLLLASASFFVLSFLPGGAGDVFGAFSFLAFSVLTVFLLILLYRWLFVRLLWTVRNRLIVTCLLMGLAPVVLFGTLAAIAAYVFSGQFATSVAIYSINQDLDRVRDLSRAFAAPIDHSILVHPTGLVVTVPELAEASTPIAEEKGFALAAWLDGRPLELKFDRADEPIRLSPKVLAQQEEWLRTPLAKDPPPPWLYAGFHGIVQDRQKLYLRSVAGANENGHVVLVAASLPLDQDNMNQIAEGLGTIRLTAGFSREADAALSDLPDHRAQQIAETSEKEESHFFTVQGGSIAQSSGLFDTRVTFLAPQSFTDWKTGKSVSAMVGVISRPTMLYQRLFATSVSIGVLVRNLLIVIAVLFGFLELLAFLMALRLSRTITSSIADLYSATTQIDRGNFAHRIRVERQDQLAALSTSFNTMAGSLQHLLEQQREKERIQSELAIAQEVQNNLFPHTPVLSPGFELHGICKPARTVSGDYYDFIVGGEGQLCLTLGDISGKGISAALLMASLHSAVRAYRFAGAELGDVPELVEGMMDGNSSTPATAFASPGKLLALLNRHLYSSTQPEKYATLFVATYDNSTRKLTYSNGGQLPPLVLCADGSVKRLDCGGSVVGLLDGMSYDEATISLEPGDLLIAYSDGVTEPENEFGEFGEDRLLEVIRQNRHHTLAAISNHAMRALRNWIGDAEQPDDITLVLARQL